MDLMQYELSFASSVYVVNFIRTIGAQIFQLVGPPDKGNW